MSSPLTAYYQVVLSITIKFRVSQKLVYIKGLLFYKYENVDNVIFNVFMCKKHILPTRPCLSLFQ